MVRGAWALLSVTSFLLAGCAGGGAGDGTVDQVKELGVDGEGDAPAALSSAAVKEGKVEKDTPGDLVGQVVDDLNLTVAGASVAILGTQLRDRTNETGWFRIEGIAPGQHTLRVEADVYQVLEEAVAVKAGAVTAVRVLLLPDARGAGYRPHLHDYWGSATQVTLVDMDFDPRDSAEVGLEQLTRAYHTVLHPNRGYATYIPIPEEQEGGRPPTILPGTGSIDVRFEWDPLEVSVPRIGLTYRTAASTELVSLEGQPSPATFTISVLPNETDNGHQGFSLWEFYLVYHNSAGSLDWRPAAVIGPVHITIQLNRDPSGARFEPGHVDRWGDKTELKLAVDPETLVFPSSRVTITAGSFVYLEEGVIVPPGTNRIALRFTWEDAGATIPGDKDMRLGWRTADQPPGQTRDPSQYYREGATSCGAKCVAFDVPVEPQQSDGYYQQVSNWAFYPYLGYEEDQGMNRNMEGGIQIGLEVTVHRDAPTA